MGIRFRKSFKIAPGVRMNLSGSGLSASFGPKGASVSVGKRGVYGNVGIPGTGLSMRTKLFGGRTQRASRLPEPQPTSVALSVGVTDDGVLFFQDDNGAPLPEHLVAIAKKQHSDTITLLIQRKRDEINSRLEAVGELHIDTPSPRERPKFSKCVFSTPKPVAPTPKVPGFFARLFDSQRSRAEAENAAAAAQHVKRVQEWEAALAEHAASEDLRRRRVEEQIYSDVEAMELHFEEVLQAIAWPRETLVASELLLGGRLVLIDVDLPEIEDMPNKTAGIPSRGMKLTVKEMPPVQVQKLYMRHVHSVGFRIIGEAFASLPETQCVILSGYSQRRDKATGQFMDEYLYSVQVTRERWHDIEFEREALKSLDIIDALARFPLRRSMSRTGVFKPIVPFGKHEIPPEL